MHARHRIRALQFPTTALVSLFASSLFPILTPPVAVPAVGQQLTPIRAEDGQLPSPPAGPALITVQPIFFVPVG